MKEQVVISGISARLPESSNVEEFSKNLFSGFDMITDNGARWTPGKHGIPSSIGRLKNINNFDASFFGIDQKQAHRMGPEERILLELVYEAIVDAGFNPEDVRGSRTGVFVGISFYDTSCYWRIDAEKVTDATLITSNQNLYANKISYHYDFKGPSYCIDSACSSSMLVLQHAFTAIEENQCNAAIVATANILLRPALSQQFHQLKVLSSSGRCRTFSSDGNGYARSEGIVVLYVQKRSEARRMYASIVNTKTNTDGYKVQGVTFPSGAMQKKLIEKVYRETAVNPAEISYFEAHGTGTPVGDPAETNAIAEVFCEGRNTPLLIGSAKSNIGHTEAASGLCGVVKVLVAMEALELPPNLHFVEPNPNIPSLLNGKLKVVDRPTKWTGGMVGINSMGFGGSNVHTLMNWNSKSKIPMIPDNMPRILVFSGRTEEGVNKSLEKMEKMPLDDEFISLLHSVHRTNIPRHYFRGYSVLGKIATIREKEYYNGEKRPVWFVFSGMGCQWVGMAKDMMRLAVFRNAVQKCANALKPEGFDLCSLLANDSEENLKNTINTLVGIVVVQIALVDILRSLGISPDGILGHSTGELLCAYADGSLTTEQTVLAAYFIAKGLGESNLPNGAMILLGVSSKDICKSLPREIDISCIYSNRNISLSGPQNDVQNLRKVLESDGIFSTEIESTQIPLHSRYIKAASSLLTNYLQKVIPYPKKRSSHWISSSIPKSHWHLPSVEYSSAAYYVNNLISPVLLKEATSHIPHNAVVIEVAPHSLLKNVLSQSLPYTCTNIQLMDKRHEDNIEFLFSGFGKMYNAGLQPDLAQFHPKVSYPVSRGTPMIAPLVDWDHTEEWTVVSYDMGTIQKRENVYDINLKKNEDEFLSGHNIDGRVLFPASGYLELVWKMLVVMLDKDVSQNNPVVFENVQFHHVTILPEDGTVEFMVRIFNCSGAFEVCTSGSLAVSGRVYSPESADEVMLDSDFTFEENPPSHYLPLNSTDIYKDLSLKGYNYKGLFKGIVTAESYCMSGELTWSNNWVTFMDTMLQFAILHKNRTGLCLAATIQKVVIDPRKQNSLTCGVPVPIRIHPNIGFIKAGGVEIHGFKTSFTPRRHETHAQPILEKYCFAAYINREQQPQSTMENEEALSVSIHIVLENIFFGAHVNVLEIANDKSKSSLLALKVFKILESEPMRQVSYTIASSFPEECSIGNIDQEYDAKLIHVSSIPTYVKETRVDLVIVRKTLKEKEDILEGLVHSIGHEAFVLMEEETTLHGSELKHEKLELVSYQRGNDKSYCLLRQHRELKIPMVIKMTDKNFEWIESLKYGLKKADREGHTVILVCERERLNGIVGLVNCIRLEPGGRNLRCIFLQDEMAPPFMLNNPFYQSIIGKDLVMNVYSKGQWGCYRHFTFPYEKAIALKELEHAYLNTVNGGDLSSLRWIEIPLSKLPNKVACSTYYSALNFKDIMLSTGKLPVESLGKSMWNKECQIGHEYSGREPSGRRIMGLVESCGLATTVFADPTFTWEVPEAWSMEDAATVPMVYCTSYYALIVRGRMQPGETLLVHAGSGGVGQASISIALKMGVTVFTTVGSEEKKHFLKKRFPQLTDSNIFNSRDTTFEKHIMFQTRGRGVDLVLNSLSEDKLQSSLRCLANHGRFLEIGKYDLHKDNILGMSALLMNKTFHGIELDNLLETESLEKTELARLLTEGIQSGAVVPLPRTIFSELEAEKAFRYMATGKHIGKVLLKIRTEEPANLTTPSVKLVPALSQTYMDPEKVYLIVGGLGGIGLQLAHWLVYRGATKIVLTSRNGITTGYQSLCVRRLKEQGITVVVSTVSCYTEEETMKLVRDVQQLGDIGGIFNLAVVLKDGLFENQSKESFMVVCQSKTNIARNLDAVSRLLCPELDYFVMFSSMICGRGNAGQSNYGLANSTMERICEARHSVSLPALAIQWGFVGEVGLVAETMPDKSSIRGTLPQRLSSCFQTLDIFLRQSYPVLSSIVVAEKKHNYEHVEILDVVANILGIKDLNKVSREATFTDLGMDSLMSAEIKQVCERNCGIVFNPREIRQLTFAVLSQINSSLVKPVINSEEDTIIQINAMFTTPSEVLVRLPSQAEEGNEQTPLFLVHPIEGVVTSLKPLAAELPVPVWGLQCTQEAPLTSIQHLASFYILHVRKVQPKGHYNLGGYSFGAIVAFEMALQLQEQGDQVTLFLIDGAPNWVPKYLEHLGAAYTMQDNNINEGPLIELLLSHFLDIKFQEVGTAISCASCYEDRQAMIVNLLNSNSTKLSEQVVATTVSFCHKIFAAFYYSSSHKEMFKGDVTLFRAKNSPTTTQHDYGLSEICCSKVAVHIFEGNHNSFLQPSCLKKVADIIRLSSNLYQCNDYICHNMSASVANEL